MFPNMHISGAYKITSKNAKQNPFNLPFSPPSITGLNASVGNRSILSISRRGRDSVNTRSLASYHRPSFRVERISHSNPSTRSPGSHSKSPTFRSRPTTQENHAGGKRPLNLNLVTKDSH